MKKIFTLIALGSVALVSADQYYQPYYQPYGNTASYCPSCNNNNYYPQGSQGYYQNTQYDYQQQSPGSQSYNQQYYQQQGSQTYQDQQYYQQQAPRNQSYPQSQYSQQQGNQTYSQDQQRNYNDTYGSQNGNNQETVSDQEINRKIKEALDSGWFSSGFKNVSYDVNNGNVTLRGSVDTQENKKQVEDNVRNINGVRQVNNQITVVKENQGTYSDSQMQTSEQKDFASNAQDRQINAKIRDKLNNKGYETLMIRTTNGVVVISGTVDKQEDLQKINDQIKNIEGVRSVNNQLRVNRR